MKILVACEESQEVTKAFRAKGHKAWSCDLLDPSGGKPEWHIRDNVLELLEDNWDMMLAFPPCTHLSSSGARWFPDKVADGRQADGVAFFRALTDAPIPKIAVENPIGIMSTRFRKPDQIIQPWQYGHGETKATCLWLKGLPLLEPTEIVPGREARVHRLGPSKDRSRLRSKTYSGIAKAMAEQWGSDV